MIRGSVAEVGTARRVKLLIKLVALGFLLLAVLGASGLFLLQTNWFKERVRGEIVASIEKATGGRVEIGEFSYHWLTLHAELRNLVIHGTEPADAKPLFRVDFVRVGIRVISLLERDVEIASIIARRPQISLLIQPDGTTNLPPISRRLRAAETIQSLLDLKLRRLEATNGVLEVQSRRIPISFFGEDVRLLGRYDARRRRYDVGLSCKRFRLPEQPLRDLAGSARISVAFISDRLLIESAAVRAGQSSISLHGEVKHFAKPVMDLRAQSEFTATDLARWWPASEWRSGAMTFTGTVHYDASSRFRASGKIAGNRLSYKSRDVALNEVSLRSDLNADADRLQLDGLSLSSPDVSFSGAGWLRVDGEFGLHGELGQLTLRRAVSLVTNQALAWNGTLSGPINADGKLSGPSSKAKISAALQIRPAAGIPVSGNVAFTLSLPGKQLELRPSAIQLPHSTLQLSGTPGSMLHLTLDTANLDDFAPAFELLHKTSGRVPVPVLASEGSAYFDGVIAGALSSSTVEGDARLTRFSWRAQPWNLASSHIKLASNRAEFSALEVAGPIAAVSGAGYAELLDYSASEQSVFSFKGQIRHLDVKAWNASTKMLKPGLEGTASGPLEVSGTLATMHARAGLNATDVVLWGQPVQQVQTVLSLQGDRIEASAPRIQIGRASLSLSGAYVRSSRDWQQGSINFKLDSNRFPVSSLALVKQYNPDLEATAELHLRAAGAVGPSGFVPSRADGSLALARVFIGNTFYGNVGGSLETDGSIIRTTFSGDLRESHISGIAQTQLSAGDPMAGQMHFDHLTLPTLNALSNHRFRAVDPLDGFLEGDVNFKGPLIQPEKITATIKLSRLQVQSKIPVSAGGETKVAEFVLKNTTPVLIEANNGVATIDHFELTGPDTAVSVSGVVPYSRSGSLDVKLDATVDNRIFALANPNLVVSGQSAMKVSVAGTIMKPALNGTVDVRNGSFFLPNLANGLTSINGTIALLQNRATITRMTAETGGGQLSLGGFITYGQGTLVYRLEANANDIRVRYPGGLSVTADAQLRLAGTSKASLLSGNATISRAVFTPNTDVGSLLATAATPASAPANERDFLTGMQLDVTIESTPNFQLTTSLSRDIQTEIDLRLRGSTTHPTLLGDIVANQGVVKVFGTTYTISRGQVSFVNPAKVEPVLDLDLQTQARGINVNISITGTFNKLNINYRSDPPLQPRDIIALLTVGRTPDVLSSGPRTQITGDLSALQSGANTVLGQAISPTSNRLSKLFGITNIKIDPIVQGIANTAQARLSLEQQISRQITVTYVTNLSQTSEQIFRVEWAFSPQFSLVALRDDNGEFGIDILFKKRFK